ncbi:DUF4272 domain-containing protein [Paenibacillus lutrae]|uniref:DUF4272 domain-containing protein n=1 Tax=Paenibacillus lutrae TaxID=2078573 RepID=A0A7X3FMN7_9BACL|nr:DUF4272 domain-containing protein [Paenibacillus lutrae]MVP02433.1 DUF4272 domain-containing protein [Paenibacillus lutrae]
MKQCTMYVSIQDTGKIMEAIAAAFRDGTPRLSDDRSQLTVTYKKLFAKHTLTFTLMTSESHPAEFEDMLKGMYAFYYPVETDHPHIKEKLLMQITALNSAVGLVSSKELDPDTMDKVWTAAAEVNGLIFFPSGAILTQGKLLMNPEGESELDDYQVTVSSGLIDGHILVTEAGEARKRRSMELLKEQGVPAIPHLPVLPGDEHITIRTREEIARRAVALCILAMYGASFSSEEVDVGEEKAFTARLIGLYQADDFFTPREQEFLAREHPGLTDAVQFAWMYECYWVLLWALGYVEELQFPGEICDVQTAVDILRESGHYDGFAENARIRTRQEILDEADLIYRYDWACVNARVNGEPAPAGLNDEVVIERHRALNWLIRYMDADWDDVRTDT